MKEYFEKNKKDLLFKLALTAIFTALCFGLTFVSIPLPTGAKVHLGNFACVLAGLLCGGIIGGIAGSLGMGLNDIASGYVWTTTLRTFITKFFLGFLVGLAFRALIKRDKATKITLYSLTSIFTVGFIATLISYILGNQVYSYVNEKQKTVKTIAYDESYNLLAGIKGYNVKIGDTTKLIELSVLVPIFMGVLALLLIGVVVWLFVSSRKSNDENKNRIYFTVATVTSISIIVNTLMEFFIRIALVSITNGFEAALAESIIKIPSNLITGVVTLIGVTVVYLPTYMALKNAGYEKYLIISDIFSNNTEEENTVTE